MIGFKTEGQQKRCRAAIHRKGMTIKGWAIVNGFSSQTVNNILYRPIGITNVLGPVATKIMKKLRKDGMA